jgi:diguanylate cyclase (GGDEF)-like protein
MIDIDHFKKFNDKMGHPEGNLALFKISRLLEKNLRTFDTVCRYGGEEFAVILPDTDVNNSKIVAERLRQAVELECKKMNQPLTVSLGISNYPLHGSTATEVISCADKALYLAKSRGKNQFALLEALS